MVFCERERAFLHNIFPFYFVVFFALPFHFFLDFLYFFTEMKAHYSFGLRNCQIVEKDQNDGWTSG